MSTLYHYSIFEIQDNQLVESYYRDGGEKVTEKRWWLPDYAEKVYQEKHIQRIEQKTDATRWRAGVLIVLEDGTEIYRFIERRSSMASTGYVEEEWHMTINDIDVADKDWFEFIKPKIGQVFR